MYLYKFDETALLAWAVPAQKGSQFIVIADYWKTVNGPGCVFAEPSN
jgi:hypothetical protein